METIESIEAAIRRLPWQHRAELLERLHDIAMEVREPAAAYRVDPPSDPSFLSPEEYLEHEARSEIRHEYVSGILYAMSGVSEPHHLIAGNLFAALHSHLRGTECRAYIADFKLRLQVQSDDLFYYPDVMVACGREGVEQYYLRYPKLVIEVLSPSTASIDRREKRLNYAQIPTMEEYVIASQKEPELFYHSRSEGWRPRRLSGLDATLELHSIELALPLTEIYDRAL